MNLLDYTFQELENILINFGYEKYRAKQIFLLLHKQKKYNPELWNNLPKIIRDKFAQEFSYQEIENVSVLKSKLDETVKLLFKLSDGNIVECVSMSYNHGNTLCISTQVGCRMGCSFCASTKSGLQRQLLSSEMLMQIYETEKILEIGITNVVLMGIGEPLDNYDNVLKFMHILHDENGKNMSYRNMTLSTCGLVPAIYRFIDENIPATLAISLHTPFQTEREKIMPIARAYDIKELMKACSEYSNRIGRITYEYTLISGINDREEDVIELKKILKGQTAHINLIRLNPINEYNESAPDEHNIKRFQKRLKDSGITATIRRELGRDISGSCGQLRSAYLSNN